MANVVKDLLVDGDLVQTRTGARLTRVYSVELTGIIPSGFDRLNAALAAVPALGAQHESLNADMQRFRVTERRATWVGAKTLRCELTYEEFDDTKNGWHLNYSGSLVKRRVSKNRLGARMSTSYTFPVDYPDAQYQGVTLSQFHQVQLDSPEVMIQATKMEFTDPGGFDAAILGALNNAAWGGFPPESLLCTRLTQRPSVVGVDRLWLREAEIKFISPTTDSWKAELAFRDPITGRPVDPLLQADAFKTENVFPVANYTTFFGFS